MLDLLANAAAGGALGLLGSVTSKIFNIIDRKQDIAVKKMEFEHQLTLLDKQASIKDTEQQAQIDITRAASDNKLRKSSYGLDFGPDGSSEVADLLRLVRPCLTIMLLFLIGLVWAFSKDSVLEDQIIDTILFCGTSSITWWFGSQPDGLARLKRK